MPRESPIPRDRARKARLFCQACGHESPPDGDWVRTTESDGGVTYRCPECGRTIEHRPAFAGGNRHPAHACN